MTNVKLIRFPAAATPAQAQETEVAVTKARLIPFPSRPAAPAAKPGPLSIGALWQALEEDRLHLHYQPQYDLTTGRTVAAEALARFVDTDGSLITPDRFIDVVEGSDLLLPFGRQVIEQACAELAACRRIGAPLQRIAVNLSARQLDLDSGLVGFVDETLTRHGLVPTDLEFELTERQHLADAAHGAQALVALAARGSRIVIDDFGVGFSSLSYLTGLPVAGFKLDRSLVSGLGQSSSAATVIHHHLALARDLNVDVVAEGIETDAVEQALVRLGCRLGQGFGYARPMPMTDLQKRLGRRCTGL